MLSKGKSANKKGDAAALVWLQKLRLIALHVV